jgi:hypothetical protein
VNVAAGSTVILRAAPNSGGILGVFPPGIIDSDQVTAIFLAI